MPSGGNGEHAEGLGGYDDDLAEGFRALREVVVASQQLRNAFANHLGVSITDTFAMGHLASDTPRTARDLAEHLGVAQSSVTAVIDRLERAGLAERHTHPTDRRALIIALTDEGRSAIADIRRWTIDALGAIDRARLPVVTNDLRLLAGGLHAQLAAFVTEHPPRPREPRRT
jgi:DNA-binding MarR family transcriptional regulator